MMTFVGNGVVTLPNPQLSDTKAPELRVNFQQSMNGTNYTYVKSTDENRYSYTFNIDVQKLQELQQFYRDNVGNKFNIEDYNGVVREVYFTENPISFSNDARASISPLIRNEFGSVSVEVIGA